MSVVVISLSGLFLPRDNQSLPGVEGSGGKSDKNLCFKKKKHGQFFLLSIYYTMCKCVCINRDLWWHHQQKAGCPETVLNSRQEAADLAWCKT